MIQTRSIVLAGVATIGLILVQLPPRAAAAATAAIPSDFNGDGHADLAIGVPQEAVGRKWDAGAVNVLYGSSTGLSAAGDQLWNQRSPGVKGKAQRDDHFGAALASGDFDADGYADLAVGVPYDHVGDVHNAGAVNVLYGSRAGLTGATGQRWSMGNLPGDPSKGQRFGANLTTGDFNGDGYWDLAIGVPGSGITLVLPGGPDGLGAGGLVTLPGGGWSGARGGAAGDLNGDGYADLATEVAGPVVGGNVGVFYGTADGLTTAGSQVWNQASLGIEDDQRYADWFGYALAIGDFDADGFADLAIGVPLEYLAPTRAGRVNVLYGTAAGLTAERAQNWHRDVPGMPEANYGQFGRALAAADFDGDGCADLAIGVPVARGAVIVLEGGPGGLGVGGARAWTQASRGVPGTREPKDFFGGSLAAADYGWSRRADLAIGVILEDVGGATNAGMVNVLYGRSTGLSGKHAQGWSQDTPGVRGTAEPNDSFGGTLTP